MSSVDVAWKGNCRNPEARYRLLGYLHRLARVNETYLRHREGPHLSLVGETQALPRPNIEVLDETREGPILVSSTIGPHPETLVTRAIEAGLTVIAPDDGRPQAIVLNAARLRGLSFRLFDPRGLYPDHDRMSFVFIECPERHFLDGRLVAVHAQEDEVYLTTPSVQLESYLEDWTDCLFSWIRFFMMGDFTWYRRSELQGYTDYRGVFKELQTARGSAEAEDATFDAVLSTFQQHAEHWIDEVAQLAKAGKA